jgi:nitronate monooxygenase
MLPPDRVRLEMKKIRQQTDRPFNVNFFCHEAPTPDEARESAWRKRLAPYYAELGLKPDATPAGGGRMPFDEKMFELMMEIRPRIVSFHFGLPKGRFVTGLKEAGCVIQSSATTVAEARWLEANGADAIVAQGFEAGGHRGVFLDLDLATQIGTFALVPQIADAVNVPVIAAGGIMDARGIVAALALGACAVQIGTAYLLSPESTISDVYRRALGQATERRSVVTNVISGRPARGLVNRVIREVGPITDATPEFPLAANALAPLRKKAEEQGSDDFSPLWAGQGAALARPMPAAELTRLLAMEAIEKLQSSGR